MDRVSDRTSLAVGVNPTRVVCIRRHCPSPVQACGILGLLRIRQKRRANPSVSYSPAFTSDDFSPRWLVHIGGYLRMTSSLERGLVTKRRTAAVNSSGCSMNG